MRPIVQVKDQLVELVCDIKKGQQATATTTAFATEDTKITKDGNGNGENFVTANSKRQEHRERQRH
jgi:hypothetical protein